jgi:glycosyltransferase involved in cell wall biosynthesis
LHAQLMAMAPLGIAATAGFDAECVVVVPNSAAALVLGARYASALPMPSATWLMDDWIQQYQSRWLTGSARATALRLLARNRGWLVISDYLGEELRRWTGITRPTAVVHNAVTIGAPPAALTTPRTGRFTLRYAGTIWPMHADALVLVARAVALRRAAGDDIELVLHTDRRGWEMYESVWRETETVFGDLVAYESLRAKLGDSDLLVVASSFEAEHARMTRSSVQTKVTDYMASGRAILNVGPADGACACFLRERGIAIEIATADPGGAAAALAGAMRDRPRLDAMARRAWEICARDHEIGNVGARMAEFLGALRPG